MTYEEFIHELDYLENQRCKHWIDTYPPKDALKNYFPTNAILELCDSCNIKWHILKELNLAL